jgi:hypothetical protein
MTTLTFEIPDKEADTVSQIIRKRGGTLIANSKDDLSKVEQISLNQSLKEAELIKEGKLKGLTFDELWDE